MTGSVIAMDAEELQNLINSPSESLSVELKRWISPDDESGIAKIVKAALAMRNRNGGYLIIGFVDGTSEPDLENAPDDVEALFHVDKIQGLITRFSSEAFEVEIGFPEKDGQKYPVIKIPSGIKTPVAAKSDLRSGQTKLISTNDIYVRTLNSNNTPSSAKAIWKDWSTIMDYCFENREADIGRFLRRHLGGISPDFVSTIASRLMESTTPTPSDRDVAIELLDSGHARFKTIIQEKSIELPDFGTWEASAVVIGNVPHHDPNTDFFNLLSSSNPRYTGWPTWLDSRGFNEDMRPHVFNGMWESLIIEPSIGFRPYYDFYLYDPKGKFYLFRALEDDISTSPNRPPAKSALDFGLPIVRCAEAIAVALEFAKAMGCDPETTSVSFAFRWSKLQGRELQSWAQPDRYISPTRQAYQDQHTSHVVVPLNAPASALGDYVRQAVNPLYAIFDGFSLGVEAVDDMTRRLVERNLR